MNPSHHLVDCQDHQIAVAGPYGDESLPPVVFLHGITGAVDFWDAVMPKEVKQSFRWASVSLPGHHPSEVTGDLEVTTDLFADQLATAIEQLYDGEPVHLVGWSTGGFSTLLIAAKYPHLVISATSVCGFVRGNWGSTLGLMQQLAQRGALGKKAFATNMNILAQTSIIYQAVLAALASAKNRGNAKFEFDKIHTDFAQHDFTVIAELFAGIRSIDATDQLKSITAPCLVIGGKQDRVITLKETKHIAANLSQAELIEVDQCGHLFYCEAPEQVWPKITDWIQQHTT